MREHCVVLLAALPLIGCAPIATEEPKSVTDRLDFGIYYIDETPDLSAEEDVPLVVALHDTADVPEGYAGQFDYTFFDWTEDTTSYATGVFKIVDEGSDGLKLQLDTTDRQPVTELRYKNGELSHYDSESERSHHFARVNLMAGRDTIAGCVATEVLDFTFEEGFTVSEYPTVSVSEKSGGGYTVVLGSAVFESGADDIQVRTNAAGELEAVVSYSGDTLVVQVPLTNPSRGRALYQEAGAAERHLMARLVCAPSAPPPAPSRTDFACVTRVPEPSGQTATIRFAVTDLNNRDELELYWPGGDDALPIAVAPESALAYTLVGGISDGYLRFERDRLRLFTDQAGYEFGELELYENSGFTRGYFRFERLDPEHTRFYTPVSCELTTRAQQP